MRAWIVIALRNIWKNRRRSAYTILAIAFGYAGVNMFGGFKDYLYSTIKNAFIHVNAMGHLNIHKRGFTSEGRREPTEFLISAEELQQIKTLVGARDDVVVVTPQLQIQGLVSNGQFSTVFVALGRVPSEVEEIQRRVGGWIAKRQYYTGDGLSDDRPENVALSAGLADVLGVKAGDDVIATAPTVAGQINALDGHYVGYFDSTLDVLDDKLMEVSLQFSQLLYDTDSVDRIVVLFNDDGDLEAKRDWVQQQLDAAGLDMEVWTWVERAPFFAATERMNNVIFLFMFLVVLVIMVMSVVNTIGMSILERTREIGTMRALGLKRRGIIELFAIESFILGLLGSAVGFLLFLLAWSVVKGFDPHWIPPTYSKPIPLEVHFVTSNLLWSIVFLSVLSLVAAIAPARKAANLEVVDALGHI